MPLRSPSRSVQQPSGRAIPDPADHPSPPGSTGAVRTPAYHGQRGISSQERRGEGRARWRRRARNRGRRGSSCPTAASGSTWRSPRATSNAPGSCTSKTSRNDAGSGGGQHGSSPTRHSKRLLVICGGLWSVAGAGSRRRWPTPKPGSGGNGASKVRPRSGQPIPGLLIPGGRWDSTNPSQRRCSSVPNWWCGSGTGIGRLAGCGMPPTAASPSNHRRLTPAAILQQQRRTC
jgi:hypothetical protein